MKVSKRRSFLMIFLGTCLLPWRLFVRNLSDPATVFVDVYNEKLRDRCVVSRTLCYSPYQANKAIDDACRYVVSVGIMEGPRAIVKWPASWGGYFLWRENPNAILRGVKSDLYRERTRDLREGRMYPTSVTQVLITI
jgi:hypothetical protein